MSDSDCVDTGSTNYRPLYDYEEKTPQTAAQRDFQYKKCFWLMEKFADIATGKIESDAVLMNEEYKLPSDFLSNMYQGNNSILYETLETSKRPQRFNKPLERQCTFNIA